MKMFLILKKYLFCDVLKVTLRYRNKYLVHLILKVVSRLYANFDTSISNLHAKVSQRNQDCKAQSALLFNTFLFAIVV